jgi:hypothetical protein
MNNDNYTDWVLENLKERGFDDSEYLKKFAFKVEREEYYCKKLHEMSPEKRREIVFKIRAKYESDEYRDKERSKKRQPVCYLYNILFRYASIYGIRCQYKPNGFFHENQYVIDNNIIIKQISGQGVLTYIEEIDKNEIIPHMLYENVVSIYNPKGECICRVCDPVSFNDVRIQAYFKPGHYFMWKGNKYLFTEPVPSDLYTFLLNQEVIMVKARSKVLSCDVEEEYKKFLNKAREVYSEEYHVIND